MKKLVITHKTNVKGGADFLILQKLLQKVTKFNLIEIRDALNMYREDKGFEYIHEDKKIESICKICEEEGFKYKVLTVT